MKNRKKLLFVLFFIVIACVFLSVAYFTLRSTLFNKGYSISDLFTSDENSSNIENKEPVTNLENSAIPGISQDILRDDLISSGFSCSDPELSENGLYRWACWKNMGSTYLEIFIFSRSLENIDFMDMNITQSESPSDQVCLDFFQQIVDLIDTSQHSMAVKSWMEKTLPDINEIRELKEADFGNIHYRLYGLPEARSLEIGILPD